jgi:hypothetical protein
MNKLPILWDVLWDGHLARPLISALTLAILYRTFDTVILPNVWYNVNR